MNGQSQTSFDVKIKIAQKSKNISKRKHLIKEGKQKNPGQQKACSNEKARVVYRNLKTSCNGMFYLILHHLVFRCIHAVFLKPLKNRNSSLKLTI